MLTPLVNKIRSSKELIVFSNCSKLSSYLFRAILLLSPCVKQLKLEDCDLPSVSIFDNLSRFLLDLFSVSASLFTKYDDDV